MHQNYLKNKSNTGEICKMQNQSSQLRWIIKTNSADDQSHLDLIPREILTPGNLHKILAWMVVKKADSSSVIIVDKLATPIHTDQPQRRNFRYSSALIICAACISINEANCQPGNQCLASRVLLLRSEFLGCRAEGCMCWFED